MRLPSQELAPALTYGRLESERAFPSSSEFEDHLRPHLPEMLRVARGMLRGSGDDLAWDAVQEVLLRLWRRGTLLPAEEAGRVLRHLTACECKHQMRTRLRRRDHEERAQDVREDDEGRQDPAGAAARGELAAQIAEALSELRPELRQAFELYELQGLDYAAIAAHVDVPVGTVRSRLSRARAALREALHANCPFCGETLVEPAKQLSSQQEEAA